MEMFNPRKPSDFTQAIVRELLDYDPETGVLTWKQRERKWFNAEIRWRQWNTRYAGKRAFTYVHKGYLVGKILGIRTSAHQLAFLWKTGRWPYEVDHRNTIGTDNRWKNLREATKAQNAWNQGLRVSNTSGFKGVYWAKKIRKWRAQINIDSRRTALGQFDTPEEAHAAWCAVAQALHGDFARYGGEE
jgi:HNH endonuclease/AP2 domain